MKRMCFIIVICLVLVTVTGCTEENHSISNNNDINYFTKETRIYDVINNRSFEGYGRLIFPVNRTIDESLTLEEAEDLYIWYNYMNSDKTVEITNYLKDQANSGNQIFLQHIYGRRNEGGSSKKRYRYILF